MTSKHPSSSWMMEVPRLGPCPAHQEWGWVPQWDMDKGQRQWELWAAPPQSPLLSSDHRFKSDRSSASTSSSVASMSEGSGGSKHPCCGQWPHRTPRGHMKINLPVFKDGDNKDAITYQSWCWDLTVYHHTGCQYCTLLPYIIHSLQGYLGSWWGAQGWILPWMMSSPYWMNTTTSRPWMLWTRNPFSSAWVTKRQYQTGGVPVKTPPDSHGIFPGMFTSRLHSWAETWLFLWWTS